MKRLFPVVVVLVLVLLLSTPSSPRDISNLSDLPQLEKRLSSAYDQQPGTRQEIVYIRKALTGTPVSRRGSMLHGIAAKTRWGTPERATAYYVCAWYGVDYDMCRDYLLNTLFWKRYYSHRPYPMFPYCWAEDTFVLLYDLYERNHDFRLLHEMVTKRSGKGFADGCGAETLDFLTVQAFADHPRGMLHVAAMSSLGRELATKALTRRLQGTEVDQESFDKAHSVFPSYVRRVAADRKDPLYGIARSLLKSAKAKS